MSTESCVGSDVVPRVEKKEVFLTANSLSDILYISGSVLIVYFLSKISYREMKFCFVLLL